MPNIAAAAALALSACVVNLDTEPVSGPQVVLSRGVA